MERNATQPNRTNTLPWLPPTIRRTLPAIAAAERMTVRDLVVTAVRELVAAYPPKPRDQSRAPTEQRCRKTRAACQRTSRPTQWRFRWTALRFWRGLGNATPRRGVSLLDTLHPEVAFVQAALLANAVTPEDRRSSGAILAAPTSVSRCLSERRPG
jgi:hypothetical protein